MYVYMYFSTYITLGFFLPLLENWTIKHNFVCLQSRLVTLKRRQIINITFPFDRRPRLISVSALDDHDADTGATKFDFADTDRKRASCCTAEN